MSNAEKQFNNLIENCPALRHCSLRVAALRFGNPSASIASLAPSASGLAIGRHRVADWL